MSRPIVSVVIPVFNAEGTLSETLQSVLDQEYPPGDMELLVVDDGSSDDSARVARNTLRPSRFRNCVITIRNQGPSAARNAGWRQARGTWIQFLDSDDLLHPAKLAVQLSVAGRAPAGVAVVYSDWQRITAEGGRGSVAGPPVSPCVGPDSITDLLTARNTVHISSQIIRKSWLQQAGGYDERHRLIEDIELLLKVAMLGGGFLKAYHNGPLSFYRQRPGSLSTSDRGGFLRACVRNASLVEEFSRSNDELSPERRKALADVFHQAAQGLFIVDRHSSRDLARRIQALVPGYVPEEPGRLKWASRSIGYANALQLACWYKRIRRRLVGHTSPLAGTNLDRGDRVVGGP